MTSTTTTPSFAPVPSLETAWQDVDRSFERFCLTAGIGAIEQMLHDAQRLTGTPYRREGHRIGHHRRHVHQVIGSIDFRLRHGVGGRVGPGLPHIQ